MALRRVLHTAGRQQASRYIGSVAALGLGAAASLYFFLPDASRGAPTLKGERLSPSHFTSCAVTSSEECGPDSRLISLTVPPNLLPNPKTFHPVWSVFIKDDDIQVERPYTPLEGVDEHGRMSFWIKRYPRGEVGRWLHAKKVGEEVEIRGPLQTWPWKEGAWDEVIMISGGTGIAPFYQLFHTVISCMPSFSRTRFVLLHSSRNPMELPPPAILQPLRSFAERCPERLQVQIFVDVGSSPHNFPDLQLGRIGKSAISSLFKDNASVWDALPWFRKDINVSHRRVLFLVCGPESMVSAIAGPYGRNFSQGPVGGALAELGATSDQVYKL